MSRPIQANAEATRRRILEQAVRLFSEHGVGETSIRDIARASGVSLAMVHHYYFSKERLVGSCVAAVYEEMGGLQSKLEAVVAESKSTQELLEAAVITGYRFARERRELIRLLLRITIGHGSAGDGAPLLSRFLDEATERVGLIVGRSPGSLRLPLQSVLYLIARYAVQAEDELHWVAGAEAIAAAGDAQTALERHVARAATQLLGSIDA